MPQRDAEINCILISRGLQDKIDAHWGQTPLNTDKENKPGLKVL